MRVLMLCNLARRQVSSTSLDARESHSSVLASKTYLRRNLLGELEISAD